MITGKACPQPVAGKAMGLPVGAAVPSGGWSWLGSAPALQTAEAMRCATRRSPRSSTSEVAASRCSCSPGSEWVRDLIRRFASVGRGPATGDVRRAVKRDGGRKPLHATVHGMHEHRPAAPTVADDPVPTHGARLPHGVVRHRADDPIPLAGLDCRHELAHGITREFHGARSTARP